MESFQTFRVTGTRATIQKILDELLERATAGWHRSAARERSIDAVKDLFCFECDARLGRPDATLWVSTKDEGTVLYDTTIVPISESRLTSAQCNNVVKSFVTDMLEPIASEYGVHVDVSGDTFEMRDHISGPTEKRLSLFSSAANKSTGASHPSDKSRWLDFILSCHNEQAKLHPEDLEAWLRHDGWSDEMASELALQYEFARDLLNARDAMFGS